MWTQPPMTDLRKFMVNLHRRTPRTGTAWAMGAHHVHPPSYVLKHIPITRERELPLRDPTSVADDGKKNRPSSHRVWKIKNRSSSTERNQLVRTLLITSVGKHSSTRVGERRKGWKFLAMNKRGTNRKGGGCKGTVA